MVQGPGAGDLVRGAGHLERAGTAGVDCVHCSVRILGVRRALLMSLVKHNVMPLVDSGAVNAQATEDPDDHLGLFVARKVGARARHAPIQVAVVMEDGAAPGAPSHEVHVANVRRFCVEGHSAAAGCCAEHAQIHLGPGILVPADDDARAVRVEKKHRRVGRRFPQDVVLDGQIQIRVFTARDVALHLVGRVDQPLGEGGERSSNKRHGDTAARVVGSQKKGPDSPRRRHEDENLVLGRRPKQTRIWRTCGGHSSPHILLAHPGV